VNQVKKGKQKKSFVNVSDQSHIKCGMLNDY